MCSGFLLLLFWVFKMLNFVVVFVGGLFFQYPFSGFRDCYAGDVAYVVRLKRRVATPTDLKDVSESDLEVIKAVYLSTDAIYALYDAGVL